MIKNIIIILISSFVFDFIFGSKIIKDLDLFSSIRDKIPKTKVRQVYKLIFIIVIAIIAALFKEYFNSNQTITSIILGFAISLSNFIFKSPVKSTKDK